MAILSFPAFPASLTPLNPANYIEEIFGIAGAFSASATLIEALSTVSYYAGGNQIEVVDVALAGSFAFGPLGTVSGTITSVTARIDGVDVMTLTGLTLDAARPWAAMSGGGNALALFLAEDDTITGTDRREALYGFDGNDLIDGLGDADSIYGGNGNDTAMGGAGNDYLYGGRGRDKLFGGDDDDRMYGGTQRDILMGGEGNDWLYGQGSDDRLNGGAGRDYLSGSQGDDLLIGGGGADRLVGGDNNDTLRGGARNDTLSGERGDDSLTGGLGTDTFVFQEFGRTGRSGTDRIEDFEAGERIVLATVGNNQVVVTTQVGDDVTIALLDNLVTVIDATLAEVQAAIETRSFGYFV